MKLNKTLDDAPAGHPIPASRLDLVNFATPLRKNWTISCFGVFALLMLTVSAQAANWYVRPTSVGSNNGADWNNAWSASSVNWSSVQPGDTVWLAGGNYSGNINFGKSGTSTSPITIKRALATDAAPVAAAGWSSGFDSTVNFTGTMSVSSINYVTLDGRTDYGIYWNATWLTSGNTVAKFSFCAGIQLAHIKMVGPGWGPYGGNGIWFVAGSNELITHCMIDGIVQQVSMNGTSQSIIEHSKFFNCGPGTVNDHPDIFYSNGANTLTYRYNVLSNCWSEAVFWDSGSSGGNYFYGNICNVGPSMNGACLETKQGYTWGDFHVFNNTFIGWPVAAVYLRGTSTANSEIYNNIFWNTPNQYEAGVQHTVGNNYFSGGSDGGAGSIGFGANPFVNLGAADYHLVASISVSSARNNGRNLGAAYASDMDGNTRGADGAWDIGAYEYGTISTTPVISISPAALTFGAVLTGQSATNYFTIQNVGAGTLAGTAAISGSSANFSVISGQSYSLAAGQSAQVGIRYTPTSANDRATLTFTGGGGATATVTGQLQAVLSGLSFPSYAGAITAPFSTNGGYLSQNVDVSNDGVAGLTTGGQAVYAFSISSPGSYTVSASVNAPNAASKSFWVNIDAPPTDPDMIWDNFPYTTGFETRTISWRGSGTSTSDQYSPKVFNLSAGVHQLFIVGREAGVQLGAITIATSKPKPPAPLNLRIAATP